MTTLFSQLREAAGKATPDIGDKASVTLIGWFGRVDIPVTVVGRTPKKLRVEFEGEALLPGRRRYNAGDRALVPTHAVTSRAALKEDSQ